MKLHQNEKEMMLFIQNGRSSIDQKKTKNEYSIFLIKVIANNCNPRLINIDKIESNRAAIKVYNKRSFSKIVISDCKCLNNIVEQEPRFIKLII